jgi:hypothetical protein
MVPEWVGSKPLIVAIGRLDQISNVALSAWKEYYTMNPAHASRPDAKVYFIDGKMGTGVLSLRKQVSIDFAFFQRNTILFNVIPIYV